MSQQVPRMLHYVKGDEKSRGCSRYFTDWSNKDPKVSFGNQTCTQTFAPNTARKGESKENQVS